MESLSPNVDPSPFLTALTVMNGAGMVLHPLFTLFVFQPSNDVLRTAFKTPNQKVKSPLRAALYPPLGIAIPPTLQNPVAMHKPFDDGFDSYLPNLMHRQLGCYGEFLKKRIPPDTRSFCATYCPDIAKPERLELEVALRMLGHRIFKIHDTPEIEKMWKQRRIQLMVFIHQSLRYQLHLLPFIKTLRKHSGVTFRFFGMQLSRALDPRKDYLINVDTRFWSFGTLILLTPKFIGNNEQAVAQVLAYQKGKAGSTKLCLPHKTLDLVRMYATNISDKVRGDKILDGVFTLEARIKTGDTIVLQVDMPESVQSDELEPGEISSAGSVAGSDSQIDYIVDRFALYHLEKCEQFRRFVVCHSVRENVESAKELFPTVGHCLETSHYIVGS
jgi:hypothetical protein